MQQAHFCISGFVQGVGFRQFIKKNSRRLGLVGWVKNTADQKVEAVVQGEKEAIEELISLCRKGPMLAEVKDVSVLWEQSKEEFDSFTVI